MKVFYNSVPLHDLGKIFIVGQSATGEPADAPQRWKQTLRIRLRFHQTGYADNYALVQETKQAFLSQQQAQLKWQDENETAWINQPVKVSGWDWPEDANVPGTHHQALDLEFSYYKLLDSTKTNCLQATLQRTSPPDAAIITLGTVERMKFDYDQRRYHGLRPHRDQATGQLSVTGHFQRDPDLSVTDGRTALLQQFDTLKAEVKEGLEFRFRYGTTDQIARVDKFIVDIDQAQDLVPWALTLSYTEFPNESGYAQAEFNVRQREDANSGKLTLVFSGAIGANTEAAARAKLSSLRTSVLAAAGGDFSVAQSEITTDNLSVADGDTFTRLTFEETLEKTSANVTEWLLRVADSDEGTAAAFRRTYSGHVEAKGGSFDAAYQTATTKARALGDLKHAFKINGELRVDDPQLSADRQTTGDFRVRVEFSFQYQLKGTRVYAEIASELNRETFGVDVESVTGFIAAADAATARNLYATIRVGYSTLLIRNERTQETRAKMEIASAPVGATKTPGNAGTWGSEINSAEVKDDAAEPASTTITNPPLLGAAYARQWQRLEFSLSVHRPKASGTVNATMKYEFDVQQDFINRDKITTLKGTVFASAGPVPGGGANTAELYLDAFLSGLSLGRRTSSTRSSSLERARVGALDQNFFAGMSFTEVFEDKLTGAAAILECRIEEEIQPSGARVVVLPTSASEDVLQQCGTQSGTRTVSGTVLTTDETTALNWIKQQRSLPLNAGAQAGVKEAYPPIVTFSFEFPRLVDGFARDGTYNGATKSANFKMVRATFRFSEVYKTLTLPI